MVIKTTKKDYIFIFLSLGLIFLDQLTKYLVRLFMERGQSISIINNFFHISYVQNKGAAFGIFQNNVSILIWFSVIILGVLLYNYDKLPLVSKSLLFAGVIGNLIDRIFFRFVIDFIDFRIWPVFNIADSCLTIGVILLAVHIIKK